MRELRARYALGSSPLTLISIARLEPNKGLREGVAALVLLRDRLPDGWRWLIIGQGTEAAALRAAIDRADLARNITLTGALPDAETQNLLACADLCLVPSPSTRAVPSPPSKPSVVASPSRQPPSAASPTKSSPTRLASSPPTPRLPPSPLPRRRPGRPCLLAGVRRAGTGTGGARVRLGGAWGKVSGTLFRIGEAAGLRY